MKLKELIDERCKFRIFDFELAQKEAKKRGVLIVFSEFKYHDHTKFIWQVVGVVKFGHSKIRVNWNYFGQAFIDAERLPEFDLNLDHGCEKI